MESLFEAMALGFSNSISASTLVSLEQASGTPYSRNLVDDMHAWAEGTLDAGHELILFTYLIDTGIAWKLSDVVRVRANALLNKGEIALPKGM